MPVTLATQTLIVVWVMTTLAVPALSAHFVTLRKHQHVHAHDWFLLSAFILGLATVIHTTWAILHEGQAMHQSDIPKSSWDILGHSLVVNETLWTLASTAMRMSAGLLMLSLFGLPGQRGRRLMLHVYLFACFGHGLASVVAIFLICRPLSAIWNSTITGHCGNQLLAYVLVEVLGLLLDILILVFPIPVVMSLQLNLKKKVSILLVLEMSVALTSLSALRLHALHFAISSDYTYSQTYLGILSAVAVMIGVSLPVLNIFLSWVQNKTQHSRHAAIRYFSSSRYRSRSLEDIESSSTEVETDDSGRHMTQQSTKNNDDDDDDDDDNRNSPAKQLQVESSDQPPTYEESTTNSQQNQPGKLPSQA